ncbi:WD40 repeat domain-containing protein [Streptomyces europaeiscabiei]|uniref:WD40 repeat domain-containing protein n=1 Tax=Streptomyces europaeiscabiei TaxID=146819 RepID=UPI002E103901|nr:WD40 repeat domain-containing protein [Streptomyces europaeiscabiei]
MAALAAQPSREGGTDASPLTPGSAQRPAPRRMGWVPWLAAMCVVGVTSVAALSPSWRVVPEDTGPPLRPERWRLVENGRLGPAGSAEKVLFAPNDGLTLVAVSPSEIHTWDLTDPEHPEKVIVTDDTPSEVSALGISPDGRTLVTAEGDGLAARTLDTGMRQWVRHRGDGDVKALVFGSQSLKLAVTQSDAVRVQELSPVDGAPRVSKRWASFGPATKSAQFSPDGNTLATAGTDGRLRLWDVSDPNHPTIEGPPFSTESGMITALAFSPDGDRLAMVEGDRTVRLWDVTDRSRPRYLGNPLKGRDEGVTTVAFSPDSRLLATVGADGTTTLWWR